MIPIQGFVELAVHSRADGVACVEQADAVPRGLLDSGCNRGQFIGSDGSTTRSQRARQDARWQCIAFTKLCALSPIGPDFRRSTLLFVEECEPHKKPEHGAADRLSHARGIVHRLLHERAVGPEAAVGQAEAQVRKPVGRRPMRLQARQDADGEVTLAYQRAHGGGDGAGGDECDLAGQAVPIATVGAQPLLDGEHHQPERHRREQRRIQPLDPARDALGVAAGADVPAPRQARQQVSRKNAGSAGHCSRTGTIVERQLCSHVDANARGSEKCRGNCPHQTQSPQISCRRTSPCVRGFVRVASVLLLSALPTWTIATRRACCNSGGCRI